MPPEPVTIYKQPNETLIYRGIVKEFYQKRGYGFIIVKALLRNDPNINFDYEWLQPLGKSAMIHYKDIITDCNVERDPENHVMLKAGQIVYFNLTLNDIGRYQAINVTSETIMTSSVNSEVSNLVEARDDGKPKS